MAVRREGRCCVTLVRPPRRTRARRIAYRVEKTRRARELCTRVPMDLAGAARKWRTRASVLNASAGRHGNTPRPGSALTRPSTSSAPMDSRILATPTPKVLVRSRVDGRGSDSEDTPSRIILINMIKASVPAESLTVHLPEWAGPLHATCRSEVAGLEESGGTYRLSRSLPPVRNVTADAKSRP